MHVSFQGQYNSFSELPYLGSGYQEEEVIENAVKRRNEKSGILSEILEFDIQNLACISFSIMKIGHASRKITILDVGGGLGAHYLEAKRHFPHVEFVWDIVETPAMAQAGREHFSSDNLRFFDSIDDLVPNTYDVILMSSVLQYMEYPDRFLEKILKMKSENIIINRQMFLMPQNLYKDNILMIQMVDEINQSGNRRNIFKSPYWMLSMWKFIGLAQDNFEKIDFWKCHFDASYVINDKMSVHPLGFYLTNRK